jgi:hypothetical protein
MPSILLPYALCVTLFSVPLWFVRSKIGFFLRAMNLSLNFPPTIGETSRDPRS